MKKIMILCMIISSYSILAWTGEVVETGEDVETLRETKADLDYILILNAVMDVRHNVRKRRMTEFAIRDKNKLFEMSKKYKLLAGYAKHRDKKKMYDYYSIAFKSLANRLYRKFYKYWRLASRLR